MGQQTGPKREKMGKRRRGGEALWGVGASGGGEMGENAPKMRERDIPPHPRFSKSGGWSWGGNGLKKREWWMMEAWGEKGWWGMSEGGG